MHLKPCLQHGYGPVGTTALIIDLIIACGVGGGQAICRIGVVRLTTTGSRSGGYIDHLHAWRRYWHISGLYHRFNLSHEDTEGLLAEGGFPVM
ncbi:MAG: hypothetical protein ACI9JM_000804 [Halioglobus sp.]|jgi:hypothetical protein